MTRGGLNTALESTWGAQQDLPPVNREMDEQLDDTGAGRIGHYDIRRRLGKGEFACVYEGVRVGAPEKGTFAVKAINKAKVQRHTSLLKSKRNIRRVNTEVMAMKRFSHAGVCALYDVMHSATTLYVVMEMGERDLFSFLDDHPDGCPEVVMKQIARILALGLRHCHNREIAHRDLKPENILICGTPNDWAAAGGEDTGLVKLCDFGLCAAITPGQMLNDFVGSPGFFAPELMTRRQYDGAIADMWSLGAVFVEMYLGHRNFDALWCPPYEHLHDVHAFSSGIEDSVARVKLGASNGPPSDPVRRLFDQLLQVEPEKRASIDEICSASWFDLLRSTPDGLTQFLRLTFDQHPGAENFDSQQRRIPFRSQPGRDSAASLGDGSTNSVASPNNNGLLSYDSNTDWLLGDRNSKAPLLDNNINNTPSLDGHKNKVPSS